MSNKDYSNIDRGECADAKRFRWLLAGHAYFLEENSMCGHGSSSNKEQDEARALIDAAMVSECFISDLPSSIENQ